MHAIVLTAVCVCGVCTGCGSPVAHFFVCSMVGLCVVDCSRVRVAASFWRYVCVVVGLVACELRSAAVASPWCVRPAMALYAFWLRAQAGLPDSSFWSTLPSNKASYVVQGFRRGLCQARVPGFPPSSFAVPLPTSRLPWSGAISNISSSSRLA